MRGKLVRNTSDERWRDYWKAVDAAALRAERDRAQDGEAREPVLGVDGDRLGDVILGWFGEHAPGHPSGGYTFAQIADLTNTVDDWVQRHARPAPEPSPEPAAEGAWEVADRLSRKAQESSGFVTDLAAAEIESYAAERERRKIEAAEALCRIYFEIAAEEIGEDRVRELRDERLRAIKETRP